MEDLNKPGFKPKFKSEYSMGELDFQRFNRWLERADLSSAIINSCEIPTLEMVQRFFAELNVLYNNWRALIAIPKIIDELDVAITEAKRQKRVWESAIVSGVEMNKVVIFNLIDSLDKIHKKLLDIKQKIGLGIVVKRIMSTKQKIKHGLNPQVDRQNLPES